MLFVTACAKNPVTGKHELSLVSSADVSRAAQESHAALVKEFGIYKDPELQAYVDSVGRRLADVSHQPSLSWSFLILDTQRVYAVLSRLEEDRNQIPTFLSTHPSFGDRAERISKLSGEVARKDPLTRRENPYPQRLEGLVFGEDPRRGYFEAERYYDLVRRFQVMLPVG